MVTGKVTTLLLSPVVEGATAVTVPATSRSSASMVTVASWPTAMDVTSDSDDVARPRAWRCR
jgi:hypothetical protein